MVALAPNTSESSSWDVLDGFPKQHSRAREVKTRNCTEALPSKSLGRVEIWLTIYDCRVGLESFTRDPIGYKTGWNYYLYGNARPVAEVDPSGNSSISGSHGISLCGSSASAPYIDPVDLVMGNPVIDNKEVIGSLYASASVDATERPAECGKNTYLHVSFFGNHEKNFYLLNTLKLHQDDFSTTACSHKSSSGEKWVEADWYCPIRCDKTAGKCEDFVFSSIVYLSQGKPPLENYFTRPGQMIAIEATVSFSGSCCRFGCVVEVQVCQLLGYGIPNNHTDPPLRKKPQLGAAAKGACKKWSKPSR